MPDIGTIDLETSAGAVYTFEIYELAKAKPDAGHGIFVLFNGSGKGKKMQFYPLLSGQYADLSKLMKDKKLMKLFAEYQQPHLGVMLVKSKTLAKQIVKGLVENHAFMQAVK